MKARLRHHAKELTLANVLPLNNIDAAIIIFPDILALTVGCDCHLL